MEERAIDVIHAADGEAAPNPDDPNNPNPSPNHHTPGAG